MSRKTKKTLIIIVSVLAAIALSFAIYWKATENDRYIQRRIDELREEISAYRSGESYNFSCWIPSSVTVEPTYIDFLSTQVSEMIDNAEYRLLYKFLANLERRHAYISEIKNDVTNLFNGVGDIEVAIEIKDQLEFLDYYNTDLDLKRDSSIITAYIETNGIEEITTTPGTGYYADETDRSSRKRVGLSTSPLYDAESVTYMGDFEITHKYGVRLNTYYEESSYSSTICRFRDNHISFSPYDGECIYSGEYLFCFSKDGTLIGADKIS